MKLTMLHVVRWRTWVASAALLSAACKKDVTGPGPAAQLAFTVQPNNAAAGGSFSPAVQVQLRDAGGNLATGAQNPVTIDIGTNPVGGTVGPPFEVVPTDVVQ